MNIEDGKKIWNDNKKVSDLARKRIDDSRKTLAKVLNMLESTVDSIKWACDDAEWDDGVAYQISDAAEKLGYALATLTTWDDEETDSQQEYFSR